MIAKFPSAGCPRGCDLHIYLVGGYSKDASEGVERVRES